MSQVLDNFLRYVKIDTKSNPEAVYNPSTPGQWDLAKLLKSELESIGAKDVNICGHCIVYATIPATTEKKVPVIGFLAHMDTSNSASGANINPRLIKNYDGSNIILNEKEKIIMSPKVFPSLYDNVGKTLVVTDGTTLLGADDKAGIAEIMSMAEYFLSHPEIPHGKIKIAFTPDEEGADGINNFDVDTFGADFAYTVDGGALGELEYENFNAAGFSVTTHGLEVHPGSSKNTMINAALLAVEFISMLPANETPSTTEGFEGFYHLDEISGGVNECKMHFLLREHDEEKFNLRKTFIQNVCDFLNSKYGEERFSLKMTDSYYNMKKMIEPTMHIVDNAKKAMELVGINPNIVPIRGGTDGAKLSYMGLPCPNLSTGGYNFHGRYEYIPVESMEKMVECIIKIAEIYAE